MCQKWIRNFVLGKTFDYFILIIVVANTAILSTAGLVSDNDTTVQVLSTTFTIIFTVELVLKVIGLGVKNYVIDKMNIFDAVIVILSLVDLISSTEGATRAISAFRSVRIFRVFRVLRVTRLLRVLDFMQVIIHVVSKSLSSFGYIALLLVLFIFIYALLGMQLYQGQLNNQGLGVRQNFDTFQASVLAVFQLLTLENWGDILLVTFNSSVNSIVTILYLISWVLIGNYVILNLFLAILLDGFTEEGIEDSHKLKDEFEEEHEKFYTGNTYIQPSIAPQQVPESMNIDLAEIDEEEEDVKKVNYKEKPRKVLFADVYCDKALFLFSKENWLRVFVGKIVTHSLFETAILTVIVLSSLKLVVDTYLPQNPTTETEIRILTVSDDIDFALNIFFTVELVLKVLYLGFVLDKKSYLTDNWNRLDFFIVISSMIDMCVDSINLPFIKVLTSTITLLITY